MSRYVVAKCSSTNGVYLYYALDQRIKGDIYSTTFLYNPDLAKTFDLEGAKDMARRQDLEVLTLDEALLAFIMES